MATIGDMPNEVLMFKKRGVSIAMGNASPEAQAAATYVTTSSEGEGFANERFVLDAFRESVRAFAWREGKVHWRGSKSSGRIAKGETRRKEGLFWIAVARILTVVWPERESHHLEKGESFGMAEAS